MQQRWGTYLTKWNPAMGWAMGAGGLGFAPLHQRAAGTTTAAQPCVLVLWGKPKNKALSRPATESLAGRHSQADLRILLNLPTFVPQTKNDFNYAKSMDRGR
ncbi:hypothetical protein [Parapedobacter sp. 10938]|uniref:hypothetical protein n=1 Tax=Parapedobacter flavus TaxID=3110225 RepID=UPI002DB84CFF|nr:hypothetical protein [Parapedobacter sp. 10938]MEC3881593.1 hypothetical protein [Parapedobacter sp. 10938]